ncbi:MAG: hypothetical protein FJX72_21350, partial [Armatimonadetes bacterium]|nr:hypothetical protein [Armatimonadota bacterium]
MGTNGDATEIGVHSRRRQPATVRRSAGVSPATVGMTLNLAILAGESSGDAFGAALAREILALAPDAEIWGLGGDRMRAAGVEVIADTRDWASIGIIQALAVAPRLRFAVLPRLLAELRRRRPAVVTPIDFGAFNVHVARWCKAEGLSVLYYLPPGSWRRAGKPPVGLAEVTDRIATQFPWSEARLRSVGADAVFVGHPLLDIVKPAAMRDQFMREVGLDSERPYVALLPGSRRAELAHNSGAMADAAHLIRAR